MGERWNAELALEPKKLDVLANYFTRELESRSVQHSLVSYIYCVSCNLESHEMQNSLYLLRFFCKLESYKRKVAGVS